MTDIDVLRDQISYIDVDPYAVASHALRFGFPGAPDLLSLMATDGRQGFAELLAVCDQFIATGALGAPADLAAGYQPRAVGALAQAMIGKAYRDGDYAVAARLHRFAHALGPVDDQPTGFGRLLVQTNVAAGEHAYVDALLAAEPDLADEHLRWIIRTDRLGPSETAEAFDVGAWSASFNEIFAEASAAPVRLGAGDGPLFDRLETAATLSSQDSNPLLSGPLVSVIMSVFAPDSSFYSSVRSVLAQTYANFELFVVDDCSAPQFTSMIEAVGEWDPRITVLRMPSNGGTYQVRNFALAHARGELVTFQDSDDWSHPERLARQVAVLTEHPEVIASLSSWVRMTPELVLNRVGYAATRVNASSMMFRREPVIERLGGFDTVRKDADSEFRERLESTYGEDAIVALPDVLAVAQLTADSLSRDDFSYGWRASTRDFYGYSYDFWHDQIEAGTASPMLDPAGPRIFPAPASFLKRSPDPVTCDIAYIADWRIGINRYDNAPARVSALLDAGLDVYAGQSINLRHAFRMRRASFPELRQLRADRGLGWLVWTEPVHAAVTVIDSAELLMFPRSAADVRLTTDRVVVAASSSPRNADRDWTLYDPRTVEQHGRGLFGVDIEWLPADEVIAADLRAAGATATILPPRGLGVAEAAAGRSTAVQRPPVVGTARLEKVGKNRLPGAKLLQCLPPDAPWDIRVLDDDEVVPKLFRKNPMPANWSVVEGVPLREFLAGLDVYVGYAPEAWGAGPTQPMLEALAAGAVLVVDPRHRPVLGDAAVYAEPERVRGVIEALVADPAAYAAQRARGDAYASASLDPKALAAFIADLRL